MCVCGDKSFVSENKPATNPLLSNCSRSCDDTIKLKQEIVELKQKIESLRNENISLEIRKNNYQNEYRITFDAYKKYYIHSKYTTPMFKIEDIVDGKKLNAIRFNVKQDDGGPKWTNDYHASGYGIYTLVNYMITNEKEKWIMKGYANIGKPVLNSKHEAYSYNIPRSGIYEFPNLEFDSREELLKYINDETKGFCNTFNNKWLFEYEFEKS
jgi:hypothetical protein